MDVKKKHNEDGDEVVKLLKDLPRVKASADFEGRLQRKIVSSKKQSERKNLFDVLFFPRRVPVFVTSILALIAVSVISYYVFLKSRDESVMKDSQPQTITESREPEQFRQTENSGTNAVQTEITEKPIGLEKKIEVPTTRDKTISPKNEEAIIEEETTREMIATPSEESAESDVRFAVPQQDDAGKEIQVQELPVIKGVEQKTKFNAVQQEQKQKIQPLQDIQTLQKMAEPRQMFEMSAAPQKLRGGRMSDSTGVADSLRQDSIKKALQKQLLQQKSKIKPNDR